MGKLPLISLTSTFICYILFYTDNEVVAHVALTFPPARKLDLDFLSNAHSKPPCGMPKGGYRTTLIAGSTINVTWHMGFAHPGGYRLELLDKNENSAANLSDLVIGTIRAQWHAIQVPDMACEDCTIRLLREITDTSIINYGLWSCADVSIVQAADYKENCLGRGTGDTCECNKPFWGNRCQYKDECATDADCGDAGNKCIDIMGTNLPKKQCFCMPGYFGEGCKMQNKDLPMPDKPLDLTSYTNTDLKLEGIQLHHKMIEGNDDKEVEFVLQAMGTSFVALGWRPKDLGEECKMMPAVDDESAMKSNGLDDMSPFKLEKKEAPYVTKFKLHPMGCSDIVVGAAQGMHTRVRDYYSRDLATPRLDAVYGGKDDLTGATGWEKHGMTTIIFRRKVNTMDPTDHALMGKMHVIWSKGHETGKDPEANMFYTKNELKYHGFSMDQRGMTEITF